MAIGAPGPAIDAAARAGIAREVDSLLAQIGGIDAAERLFRILRDTAKQHSGMWLLGNVPTPVDRLPEPAVPTGWLLSLALRKIQASSTAADSATTWEAVVGLAINFAASTDCQRYIKYASLNTLILFDMRFEVAVKCAAGSARRRRNRSPVRGIPNEVWTRRS